VLGAIIYFHGQIQRKHYNVFTAEAREGKREEDIGCKVNPRRMKYMTIGTDV
jgi:hypothetical protein